MSLKQRRSSETERNLGGIIREVDDHCLRRAPTRLPSASSLARCLLPLPAISFLGALVMEEESLDWQRREGKRLGEKLGAPTVLFMGVAKRSWPWIMVHIPRNLEGGEVSLTESPSSRLGFKLSHIRLTGLAELRSECYSGMALFRRSYRMNRPKSCKQKMQRMENEVCDKQSYKDGQSFSYKLFGTIKCSNTLQLH
jgi:hypothetical protein